MDLRRICKGGVLRSVFAGLLSVGFAVPIGAIGLGSAPQAAAAATEPPTMWSFYVNSTTRSAAETLGLSQCNANNRTGASSWVLLDFGRTVNGTGAQYYFGTGILTQTTILSIAEYFATGYAKSTCAPAHDLDLAIGTSNDGGTNQSYGEGFGRTIGRFVAWLAQAGITGHVAGFGSNDIEGAWSTYAEVTAWYSGYAAETSRLYFDNGAATGCEATKTYSGSNIDCSSGWQLGDYYNAAWRFTEADSLPQIYVAGQATQWHCISTYGSGFAGQIEPDGLMVTPGYQSSTSAWTQMSQWFDLMNYIATMRYE